MSSLPACRLPRRAESWFQKHQRNLPWRETYDPYHIWLSEVMLQQTRMEVVLRYYGHFLERFPSIRHLRRATSDDVAAAWSGLGYYRRARMLHAGAVAVGDRFGGALPSNVESLLTIPGIGRYTAGAIASIAYDRPAPIVDGNIARILARLFGVTTTHDLWARASELVQAADSPRMFNQALMEIGALICKPKHPRCDRCPLRSECRAYASGRTELAPGRRPETRTLRIPLYIVSDRRGRILMRRESGALFDGMFLLPDDSRFKAVGSSVGKFRHTITNRRITYEVFLARPPHAARRPPFIWIEPKKLENIPHPSFVRKALRLAGFA